MNSDFRHHFAVERDASFDGAFDEAAIADVVQFASAGKSLNPESAKIAFAVFAVAKMKGHGAVDGFGGHAEAFTTASIKAFG